MNHYGWAVIGWRGNWKSKPYFDISHAERKLKELKREYPNMEPFYIKELFYKQEESLP